MMLPPRPLPFSDRLQLSTRFGIDSDTLRRLEQLGLSRDQIFRLCSMGANRPPWNATHLGTQVSA